MSPEQDFRVDKFVNQTDPYYEAEMARRSAAMAKDELKNIIMKQRIELGKNTRLYKAMRSTKMRPSQSI